MSYCLSVQCIYLDASEHVVFVFMRSDLCLSSNQNWIHSCCYCSFVLSIQCYSFFIIIIFVSLLSSLSCIIETQNLTYYHLDTNTTKHVRCYLINIFMVCVFSLFPNKTLHIFRNNFCVRKLLRNASCPSRFSNQFRFSHFYWN